MATRHEPDHRAKPAAESLPEEHQGFVRSADVHDASSQAAAPQRSAHALDRTGEKRYEHALRDFERTHAGSEPVGDRPRTLEDQSAVRDAILRELADDPELRGVVVAERDGRVSLSGEVPDAAARGRAQDLAAAASGVEEVVNHIMVRA